MRWGVKFACGHVLLALCLAFAAPSAHARQQSHIVLDYGSGAVLDASGADKRAFPASLTKMMTLYLTFRALEAGQVTMRTRLKVSERAARMPPTKLSLKPGTTLKVEDAVLGLVTRSANDAAAVLAEGLGGSESRFALLMTRTARRLGMSRTVFKNASGLPDRGQFSTARDLSRLAMHLIADYPKYYPYFSRAGFTLGSRAYANHNRLLKSYAGMDGLKTGYTRASGFNLAASAVRDGNRVVAVVLGGRTAQARDERMAGLLDASFEQLERREAAAPLVAMTEPSPRKPELPAAAILIAAAAAAEPASPEAEIVVASVTGEAAATMTDVPVPAPRVVKKSVAVKAPLRGQPAAPRKAAQAKAAKPAARSRSASGELFGVQVGAFQAPSAARSAAERALRIAPDLLRGTFASVSSLASKREPLFRATLMGLDRSEAEQACRLLQKQRQDCFVVRAAPIIIAQR